MTIGLSKEEIAEIGQSIGEEWRAQRAKALEPLSMEEGVLSVVELLKRFFVTIIIRNNQKIGDDLRALGLIPD